MSKKERLEKLREELENMEQRELLGDDRLDQLRERETEIRMAVYQEEVEMQDDAEYFGEDRLNDMCEQEIEARLEHLEQQLDEEEGTHVPDEPMKPKR